MFLLEHFEQLRQAGLMSLLIPTSRAHQFELLRIAANDAIRSIVMQAHRMQQGPLVEAAFADESFQRQMDARFLLVAVRWLHRLCATGVALTHDPDLCSAVEDFEHSVMYGRANEMRNVWEHFDDYVVGKGWLQRPGRRVGNVGDRRGLAAYVWTGSGLGSLFWAGVEVNFDLAVSRAHQIYAALTRACPPVLKEEGPTR